MQNETVDKTIEAKREYYREWRKKNPERVAKIQERFWQKKSAKLNKAAADPGRQERDREE